MAKSARQPLPTLTPCGPRPVHPAPRVLALVTALPRCGAYAVAYRLLGVPLDYSLETRAHSRFSTALEHSVDIRHGTIPVKIDDVTGRI
jgi:hypothetical protein